jgi:hypothetical protein
MDLKYPSSLTYSFNFSYTAEDTYWILLCNNASATFLVSSNPSQQALAGGFVTALAVPDINLSGLNMREQLGSMIKSWGKWFVGILIKFYWAIIPIFLILWFLTRKSKPKVIKFLDKTTGVSS